MAIEKTNWRDKVKSPTKTNEKMIGGENSLPKREGDIINHEKIAEDAENRKVKQQEFDKKLNTEKTNESFTEKDKRAIKEYENRLSKPTQIESDKPISKIADKIDEIVDDVGKELKKIAPYLDDIAKGIGEFSKFGGLAGGVIGFLNPESIVDDETEQKSLKEWEEKQNQSTERAMNSTAKEMRNLIFDIKEIESPIRNDEPIIIEENERTQIIDLINDFQSEIKSAFPLEKEKIVNKPMEIDIGDPSMDSTDGSDGSDGGSSGGDGGE